MTLQTSAAKHSMAATFTALKCPQSFDRSPLGERSENSFFALKALFRGGCVLWVSGGAGCLWEAFWTAHGGGQTQSTAALEMKILLSMLPGTARHALSHHLFKQHKQE